MAPPVTEFRFRRGTSDRWTELNLVLGPGEPGVESDTGRFKIGDGYTKWNLLEYFPTEAYVEIIVDEKLASTGGSSSDPRIGDLSELTTESKATVVAAINEINMDGVEFTLLYDNAKAG